MPDAPPAGPTPSIAEEAAGLLPIFLLADFRGKFELFSLFLDFK
jgi:hypothetical protein